MIPINDDNPTERPAILTVALIAACVLVYLWQMSLGEYEGQRLVYALGMIPAVLLDGQRLHPDLVLVDPWVTLFSSMFLHGGLLHLGGNMLYLWIFGNNVEDALGRVRFILFYLACGVAAALLQAGVDPQSPIPMIGASGAISGVLGAYLLLYPRANVLVLIPLGWFTQLRPLPAVFVLGFYFVLQLISAVLDTGEGGGVALPGVAAVHQDHAAPRQGQLVAIRGQDDAQRHRFPAGHQALLDRQQRLAARAGKRAHRGFARRRRRLVAGQGVVPERARAAQLAAQHHLPVMAGKGLVIKRVVGGRAQAGAGLGLGLHHGGQRQGAGLQIGHGDALDMAFEQHRQPHARQRQRQRDGQPPGQHQPPADRADHAPTWAGSAAGPASK